MSSRAILACNWKMNLAPKATTEFCSVVARCATSLQQTELWVTPPFVSIAAASGALTKAPVKIGAQNVHWLESGAFTGEIAPSMLRELGCEYAIVGHSERRHLFAESDQIAAKRAVGGLQGGLSVLFCIGETLQDRERNQTTTTLRAQLLPLCSQLSTVSTLVTPGVELLLAYEPVWAIGTGKVASPAQVAQTTAEIAMLWRELCSLPLPKLLYGGSVDPTNAGELIALQSIDGFLVGGASISEQKLPALATLVDQGWAQRGK